MKTKLKHSELVVSPILFDEGTHTYTNADGVVLSGVTSILGETLFKGKYDGVPEHILRNAAERGTEIHAQCQLSDYGLELDSEPYQETLNYQKLIRENNINMVSHEYLISDNERVATMIDCIDEDVNLYDIKTTYVLDKEYVAWQLSICAYLFEIQNKDIKVGGIYAIWLKNKKYELIALKRKSKKQVNDLLQSYFGGAKLDVVGKSSDVDRLVDLEQFIIDYKNKINEIEEQKQAIVEGIRLDMEKSGVNRLETDRLLVTIVPETTSKGFDKKRFEDENPVLAKVYQTETKRKGYVKITLR